MMQQSRSEECVRLSLREVSRSGVPPAEAAPEPRAAELVAAVELVEPVGADVQALARAIGASDRITIGVAAGAVPDAAAPLVSACDLVIAGVEGGAQVVAVPDPEAELARLVDAVDASPRAAYALAGTLRAVAALPVADALFVESAAYSLLLGGPEFARWLRKRPAPTPPPPARTPCVRVSRDDGTLQIALARPERRNAFGSAMRDELVEALRLALLDDSIVAVELSGDGPCFSSGGDLAEFGTAPDVATAHLVRTLQSPARLMAALSHRLSAFVHGPCIGAGVELPPFAGTVVAAPGTTFTLPELGMGLIPGAGGTVGVSRRVGRCRTAWLALTGATLDAAMAREWGLVDAIGERG